MNRRAIFGVALGVTLARRLSSQAAAEASKLFRLAVVVPFAGPGYRAFEDRLRQLGYQDGRNLKIDPLHFEDDVGRLSTAIAAAVDRGADAILAGGPEVTLRSATAATRTVPIVIVAIDYDPLARGYVKSLARPEANITGVSLQQIELAAKRLELLMETVPALARVVALWDQTSADQFESARQAARSLKISLEGIECADPPYDYDRLLAGVDGMRGDVLLAMTSPGFFADRERLSGATLRHRLPAMFVLRQWVDVGGLMCYGASIANMYSLAAGYVDRIAKGAVPVDLPVEQPTRFELVINLKTAKALGLTIPQSILARADEVIE